MSNKAHILESKNKINEWEDHLVRHKHFEKLLAESEARYQNLIDNIPDIVFGNTDKYIFAQN